MTHRVFSRNASSSRAIPIEKVLELVEEDIVKPMWTNNKAGMQGKLVTDLSDIIDSNRVWLEACYDACKHARRLQALGRHKQNVNRLLEPFQHIKVIVTATDFDNWFNLRYHEDAQGRDCRTS